jgi:membrane protein DedA with SNARE-associated domain
MLGNFVEWLLAELSRFVIAAISRFGYAGIFITMAIESACIPLPSEIIMPFSGYLISTGQFTMLGVTLAGALGNVAGSLVAFYVGIWGGRPFVERYGGYVLISRHDLAMADRWFARYGEAAVLISRMLPVIRTFISLPAGVARMPVGRFILFTFVGALPWCYLLAFIGLKLGERWQELRQYFHQIDVVIGILLVAALAYFVWSHWPRRQGDPELGPP